MSQYSRLVFVLMSLVVLSIIVTCFACYHIFLAVTNQTTNERYKQHNFSHEFDTSASIKKCNTRMYDRGIWQNIADELFPLRNLHLLIKQD